MKERMFLVDTENISDYSFFETMEVGNEDIVVMFITENSKAIKIDALPYILKSDSNIIFEKVSTGIKNELDFQLIAYLGMCATDTTKDYYIISNDKGFETAINFLVNKIKNVNIELRTNESKIIKDSCIQIKSKLCKDAVSEEIAITKELQEQSYTIIDFAKLDKNQRAKECKKIKIRQLMEVGIKDTNELIKITGLGSTGVKKYKNEINKEGEIKILNENLVSKLANKLKIKLEQYA